MKTTSNEGLKLLFYFTMQAVAPFKDLPRPEKVQQAYVIHVWLDEKIRFAAFELFAGDALHHDLECSEYCIHGTW